MNVAATGELARLKPSPMATTASVRRCETIFVLSFSKKPCDAVCTLAHRRTLPRTTRSRIPTGQRSLLPLDRARGLARHVVDHAVDSLDLVDDAGGDMADELHVEGVEVGGHTVGRGHGAQAHHIVVGTEVAHHADGAHRKEHRERLPDVVVEPGSADLLDIDVVGEAQDVELVARDLAGAADGEPR